MTVEVNSAGMLYQRNANSMNRWMTPASSKVLYFLASTQSVNLCFVPFLKIFMYDHIISEVFIYIYILNSTFFILCFDVLLYLNLVIHESTF